MANTEETDITKRQGEIISLLFRYRFLNRIQIQRFLRHKDEAGINRWLKDLSKKEYIKPSCKNTQPAVYHLAKAGIRYLKEHKNISVKTVQKYYRENERSVSFINSCLLLADICLDLTNRDSRKVRFEVSVKSEYDNHPSGELLKDLSPTAYIRQTTKNQTKDYFLEILYNVPKERLRQRVRKYLSFYQWSDWEAETETDFPTILIICPSNDVLTYVKRYFKTRLALLDEPELAIHLTTEAKARQFGLTGDIWKRI